MSMPKRIENGKFKGKVSCPQYTCKHNYGVKTGSMYDNNFPNGCCKLENPKFSKIDDNTWGCSDERYVHEIK